MKNSQWLYDQVPGPDDEDDGVHLTSAHAMQIAGELTALESKLEAADDRALKLEREACDDEDRYHNALARIAALEVRLELFAEDGDGLTHKLDIGSTDGIACRDETIKRLRSRLDACERERDTVALVGGKALLELHEASAAALLAQTGGTVREVLAAKDAAIDALERRLDFLRGLAAGGELEALADALTDDGQFAAMMAAQEELPSERVVERHDHKCPVNDWCVLDRAHWGECKTLEQHKSE